MRPRNLVPLMAVVLGAFARASAQPCPPNPAGGPDELALGVRAGRIDFAGRELPLAGGMRMRLCLRDCSSGTHATCSANGGTAAPRGSVLAPPVPLLAGGGAVCVITRLTTAPRGTADVATGAVDVALGLAVSVFPPAGASICPRCSGGQVGASGLCEGGARAGQACVVDDVGARTGDCPPAGRPLATVARDLALTSGTVRLSGRCAGRPARDRTGTASQPEPPWPDSTYPKRSRAGLAALACAPGTGNPLVDPVLVLPAPVGTLFDVTLDWLRAPLTSTTTTAPQAPGTTTTPTGVSTGGGAGRSTASTTTLARGTCRTAADCDDGDPCTDDHCPEGRCANPARSGVDGALCQVQSVRDVPLCGTEPIDPHLLKTIRVKLAMAENALERAASATSAARSARLLSLARRSLEAIDRKTARFVGRKRISVPCAQSIDGAITAMRAPLASGAE